MTPATPPAGVITGPVGPGSTSTSSFDNPALGGDRSRDLPSLANSDISAFRQPAINPLQLTVELQDRVLNEGTQSFAMPANAFRHTDPAERIAVEATLPDGSALPSYVIFDSDTGTFTVDTDVPREAGVEGIDIRVKGRDTAGNEVSTTFFVAFTEAAQSRNASQQAGDAAANTEQRSAPADGAPQDAQQPDAGDGETPPPANDDAPSATPQQQGSLDEVRPEGRQATAEQLDKVGRQAAFTERDRLLADLLSIFRASA
ncbi:hypothetical protein AUP43_14735 [Oceanibaculum pacificum]|uniref:Dystroglycan-type cadherin-like domain-containing protein n=1 Tax=Oceanibaculum pacificum TaxID=580166 RepID=A0A154VC01_9PROT|nr:hypothetical protein AUP43_14735 [Oceanibaculum pacificum]